MLRRPRACTSLAAGVSASVLRHLRNLRRVLSVVYDFESSIYWSLFPRGKDLWPRTHIRRRWRLSHAPLVLYHAAISITCPCIPLPSHPSTNCRSPMTAGPAALPPAVHCWHGDAQLGGSSSNMGYLASTYFVSHRSYEMKKYGYEHES